MKILYYNWVPFLDPLKRGGGVRIYLEGLVKRAVAEGHHVTYLSAGLRHNLLRPGLRVRRVADKLANVREYEIVNSPILAPSHANFGRVISDVDKRDYIQFLQSFIRAQGPFDIIHLQNIEGLPAGLFEQPAEIATRKVFLSLHNYNVLCQQVNLWYDEREACTEYLSGRRCSTCLVAAPTREVLIGSTIQELVGPIVPEGSIWQARAFALAGRSRVVVRRLARFTRAIRSAAAQRTKPARLSYKSESHLFRDHRSEWINAASRMTKLIAVSNRVRQVFADHGVDENILVTKYISTAFAAKFLPDQFKARSSCNANNDRLRLGFLGYMRRDKGFFFLLDAIEKLPALVQARLTLKICAPNASSHKALIERKLAKLADWEVIDGYGHDDLPKLLSDIDLGIVPVLWEDNMPQVGYEFVCHGVPIFAANKGGVSELVSPREMTFDAGNVFDFGRKLERILNDRTSLISFWDHPAFPILDWNRHWTELDGLYNE